MLGSAATGVVGGVIDNTLGNVLGLVGQGNSIGVGNMLNAVSLVLNRFVNRDNPLSGRVDIAGGVLIDKAWSCKATGATANVATRTNLVNATTDTTVNFMIGEDSSAPYITVTARGPLASPSLNVTRGTAKDPPGMASTLPIIGNCARAGRRPSRSPFAQHPPSQHSRPVRPLRSSLARSSIGRAQGAVRFRACAFARRRGASMSWPTWPTAASCGATSTSRSIRRCWRRSARWRCRRPPRATCSRPTS